MIDYIKGTIAEISPARIVIEASGIGYDINITLPDFTSLQNAAEAKMYIHESIREDAHILFGFSDPKVRDIFRLLIGVSGVGPGTARLILSALSASDLEYAISSGQDSMLKNVKGIGAKTAQRIIVDLKDKIKSTESTLNPQVQSDNERFEEALAALITLGFNREPSRKALSGLYKKQPDLTVEDAIKKALKML